jgi:DNA-binding transcriptional LysR family regulator
VSEPASPPRLQRQAADRRRSSARRPIREQLSQAARIAEMMMGLPAGRAGDFAPVRSEALRLGISASLSCGRLRALLRTCRTASPQVEVSLAALPCNEVARRIRSGELDVGVVSRPASSSRLEVEALWTEALFAVLPADHPLARENAVDPSRLAGQTLLTSRFDLDEPERLMGEAVDTVPTIPLHPVEADRETLFNMVALGFGVAITSGSALGVYYPGVVYRPLLRCDEAVRYAAIWRADNRHADLPGFVQAARAMAARSEIPR